MKTALAKTPSSPTALPPDSPGEAARKMPWPRRRSEAYPQDFLTENPRHPYIVYNDLPKLANLKQVFPARYRVDPVLVKRRS